LTGFGNWQDILRHKWGLDAILEGEIIKVVSGMKLKKIETRVCD
jgi:hypothetical protein